MEGQAIKDWRLDIFIYMNIWMVVIVCILRTFFVDANWVVWRYGSENVSDQPECWLESCDSMHQTLMQPKQKKNHVKRILECKRYSPRNSIFHHFGMFWVSMLVFTGCSYITKFIVDIASQRIGRRFLTFGATILAKGTLVQQNLNKLHLTFFSDEEMEHELIEYYPILKLDIFSPKT